MPKTGILRISFLPTATLRSGKNVDHVAMSRLDWWFPTTTAGRVARSVSKFSTSTFQKRKRVMTKPKHRIQTSAAFSPSRKSA